MPNKDGRVLTATEKAERARATTRAALTRDLLYGGILSRLWPSYVVATKNPEYPWLLCVETPIGELLTWRIAVDEADLVVALEERPNTGEKATDRTPILMALAQDGWPVVNKA